MRYLLRQARSEDLAALLELAHFLDSPNLPADADFLLERLERSERAFAEPGPPSAEREYQFALEDLDGRVVGTSAILSKHGTPGMPHIALHVREEKRHSASLGKTVVHRTLQLGATEDGPTELGALVLHPDARGRPGSPGKLLSWGRFAYIARHRSCFEKEVLAEMRASLDPEGRNAFWEAFGRRFTGLSYDEADRRSAVDKTFILDLFPNTPFYASLLDESVAAQLGRVHPEAAGALRLLERAGMRWNGEIDPFDAGPFYSARTEELVPVRGTVQGVLAEGAPAAGAALSIASTEVGGGFRAVVAEATLVQGAVRLLPAARARLRASAGDEVALTPFPASSPGSGGG